MKFTVTNGQIVAANAALQSKQLGAAISQEEGGAPIAILLTARTRLLNAVNALAGPLATLQTLQQEIVDRYTEKDEKGNARTGDDGQLLFRAGSGDDLQKELDALAAVETEVNVKPLSLKMLGQALTQLPDYGTLNAISWMLDDDLD